MSKKIIIEIQGDDIKIDARGEFKYQETITILGNTILNFANQFVEAVPKEHQEKSRELIYDSLNEHFSGILETFAPEIELRPDLTVEAIAKAEDEILSKMQNKAGKE